MLVNIPRRSAFQRQGYDPMVMTDTDLEILLTAEEVRKILSCSLPLVYKLADAGALPCVRWECLGTSKSKPRHVVRFRPGDVMNFIEEHSKGTPTITEDK